MSLWSNMSELHMCGGEVPTAARAQWIQMILGPLRAVASATKLFGPYTSCKAYTPNLQQFHAISSSLHFSILFPYSRLRSFTIISSITNPPDRMDRLWSVHSGSLPKLGPPVSNLPKLNSKNPFESHIFRGHDGCSWTSYLDFQPAAPSNFYRGKNQWQNWK